MVELLWAQDTRTSTGLSDLAKLWFDMSYSSRPCGHAGWKLICTVWEAPNLGFWIRLSEERPMLCNYHFQLYRFVGQKNGAGGRPIRCQSSFTQDLQGGDLLLKLFLAEVVHSLADVPLVFLVKKPMDLMGQSLSQLHFTKDGDQELFLGCFTMEPSIAGQVHDRIFVCRCGSAADTQVRSSQHLGKFFRGSKT